MSYFEIEFMRIPSSLGGYDGDFYNGMRVGISWQKFLSKTKQTRNDISLYDIVSDEKKLFSASCKSIIDFPDEYLQKGELIVLMGTYNIIAIGKVL